MVVLQEVIDIAKTVLEVLNAIKANVDAMKHAKTLKAEVQVLLGGCDITIAFVNGLLAKFKSTDPSTSDLLEKLANTLNPLQAAITDCNGTITSINNAPKALWILRGTAYKERLEDAAKDVQKRNDVCFQAAHSMNELLKLVAPEKPPAAVSITPAKESKDDDDDDAKIDKLTAVEALCLEYMRSLQDSIDEIKTKKDSFAERSKKVEKIEGNIEFFRGQLRKLVEKDGVMKIEFKEKALKAIEAGEEFDFQESMFNKKLVIKDCLRYSTVKDKAQLRKVKGELESDQKHVDSFAKVAIEGVNVLLELKSDFKAPLSKLKEELEGFLKNKKAFERLDLIASKADKLYTDMRDKFLRDQIARGGKGGVAMTEEALKRQLDELIEGVKGDLEYTHTKLDDIQDCLRKIMEDGTT